MATFNAKFAVAATEKGTAFRRTTRADLDWIFTVQTERVVAKDNTVAIGDRDWQIEKHRFRNSLAHRAKRPLGIALRDSHFPTAAATGINMGKNRNPRSASSRGTAGLVN